MRLEGATVLVTGASSGIGRAVAAALAGRGASVLAAGRDERALGELAAETGAVPLVCELSSADGVRELAESARERAEQVDVLVNNAGIGWRGDFGSMEPGRLQSVLDVNVRAPVLLTRYLIGPMQARRSGAVLFVGSVAGLIGVREEAVYAASKAAVQAFADSLREELAGSGVAIVTVAPGAVRTPFFERRGTPYDRRWPRPVAAERVAGVVVAALAAGRSGDYVVPGWLALPVRLRGALPGAYRRLARRFG